MGVPKARRADLIPSDRLGLWYIPTHASTHVIRRLRGRSLFMHTPGHTGPVTGLWYHGAHGETHGNTGLSSTRSHDIRRQKSMAQIRGL